MHHTHTKTINPRSEAFEMRWRGPSRETENMLVDFDSRSLVEVQTSLAWHGTDFEMGGAVPEADVEATIGLAFEWLEAQGARVYAHRVIKTNEVVEGHVIPHMRAAVVPRHFAQFRNERAGPRHMAVSYPVLVIRDPVRVNAAKAHLPPEAA